MGCTKNDKRILWKKQEAEFSENINFKKIYEAGSTTLSSDVNVFIKHIRNDATTNKLTKNIWYEENNKKMLTEFAGN